LLLDGPPLGAEVAESRGGKGKQQEKRGEEGRSAEPVPEL